MSLRMLGLTRIRYIQKFYQMRTQLQAISLRIQVSVLIRRQSTITDNVADGTKQRADDAVHERSDKATGHYEQADEPPGIDENRHGV